MTVYVYFGRLMMSLYIEILRTNKTFKLNRDV